jgi:hypothetical protein
VCRREINLNEHSTTYSTAFLSKSLIIRSGKSISDTLISMPALSFVLIFTIVSSPSLQNGRRWGLGDASESGADVTPLKGDNVAINRLILHDPEGNELELFLPPKY